MLVADADPASRTLTAIRNTHRIIGLSKLRLEEV